MIYKYTKCESVIAKIMADLDSTEVLQRTSDIREWIFEAIEKIGAPVLYIQRESGVDGLPVFKIQDYQIPIPEDLANLDGVAYSENENGPWVPVDKSTSVFNKPRIIEISDRPQNGEDDENIGQQEPKDKSIAALMKMYGHGLNKYYERDILNDYVKHPQYHIKPGWLVINRNKGYIKLAYKAIPTDERGYPLVPDNVAYQEAIYWYVVMKLSFPKFLSGRLGGKGVNTAGNTYSYIQQQWHFYRNQAYAEAIMPNADDMRNIKREWNRLVPEYATDEYFFRHLNDDQHIYNDYYYGY